MNIPTLDTTTTQTIPKESVTNKRRELLEPLSKSGEFLLVLDNSAMEWIQRCPTSAFYHLVMSRQAHAKNSSLTFGGALHIGVERLELAKAKEEPEDETATAKAMLDYFSENGGGVIDEYRTPQNALEVMAHYRERCKLPDYYTEILFDSAGPIVERAFELPLGVLEVKAFLKLPQWEHSRWIERIHVAWSGRIDGLPQVNDKNRVKDTKTTSIGGEQFSQSFQLSNQTIGYVWAGQQLWPAFNISGCMIDAIWLKKPSKGCGLTDRGPRGGEPALQFFRLFFDYPPIRVAEWASNAMLMISDFVGHLVSGEYPMYMNHCFNKYGKCQFHDICLQDEKAVRLKMLQSDAYKDVTWNPTSDR